MSPIFVGSGTTRKIMTKSTKIQQVLIPSARYVMCNWLNAWLRGVWQILAHPRKPPQITQCLHIGLVPNIYDGCIGNNYLMEENINSSNEKESEESRQGHFFFNSLLFVQIHCMLVLIHVWGFAHRIYMHKLYILCTQFCTLHDI